MLWQAGRLAGRAANPHRPHRITSRGFSALAGTSGAFCVTMSRTRGLWPCDGTTAAGFSSSWLTEAAMDDTS